MAASLTPDARRRWELVALATGPDLGYNIPAKTKFHRLGRQVLGQIATALRLPEGSYTISSNKAGPAIGGEVTLHAEHVYICLAQGCSIGQFMYRACRHAKDYAGLANRWMDWTLLREDFDKAIERFALARRAGTLLKENG
jgi:hypothetical protein